MKALYASCSVIFILAIACTSGSSDKQESTTNTERIQDSINIEKQKAEQLLKDEVFKKEQQKLELVRNNYIKKIGKLEESLQNKVAFIQSVKFNATFESSENVNDYTESIQRKGVIEWKLDEAFSVLKIKMELLDHFVSSGGEEAYEETTPIMLTQIYFDSNDTTLIDHMGWISSSTDAFFYGKENDTLKTTKSTITIPDFDIIKKDFDYRTFNTIKDKNNNILIVNSNEGWSKASLSALQANLKAAQVLKKEFPESIHKAYMLLHPSVFKSDKDGKVLFEPTKTEIEIKGTKNINDITSLLNWMMSTSGYIKTFPYDTITDTRTGVKYPTIKIGEQVWTATNCDYSPPSKVYGSIYLSYKSDKNPYSKPAEEACPEGWHLPTTEEWNTLFNQFGGVDNATPALITDNPFYWEGADSTYNASGFAITQIGSNNIKPSFFAVQDSSGSKLMRIVKFGRGDEIGPIRIAEIKGNIFGRCRCVKD